jgi:hypothetical protein
MPVRFALGRLRHRYAAADEIGCKSRQPIELIFRPAIFNRNVPAFNKASFGQALLQCRERFARLVRRAYT